MKEFLGDDFLLQTDTARQLYHDYAADLPIYDYHCHLNPAEIAENKRYDNMAQIWLAGDHYKWRGMRSNGVSEKYCTGDASDYEKFQAWAETVPWTLGNPLFHWTHMELKRPFGISGKILSPETAEQIWNECNEKLAQPEFSARGIIKQMNVSMICTTDDPVDDLSHHRKIAADGFETRVNPAWRPDKGVNIHMKEVFIPWIEKLSEVSGQSIATLDDLKRALVNRLDFFHANGCRISDHGLAYPVYEPATDSEAGRIFKMGLEGSELTLKEREQYQTNLLLFLGREYAERGWVMQLHMNALRNNSSRMYKKLGPDTGFDSIADYPLAEGLSGFLDSLDCDNKLPKTILYSLNPRDNYLLGTMIGNFQDGSTAGKMQLGSGWWFCDQKEGMEQQMSALANLGMLSRFVGMLTDSRSFLSYTRHEYFRRILCNLTGNWVENGEFPKDFKLLEQIIKNVCYNNSVDYFGMKL